jgi:predicted RNase H-like HicB family nuclease
MIQMKHRMLNFTVLIEQDEDGIYVAKVPDIPGCYTQGRTVEQAMERIVEAIQVCLEADDEMDAFVPMKFVGLQQVEVKV